MPKVPHNRGGVVKAGAAVENPAGRVDILLLRLGELATRSLERKLGGGVNLWDGPEGVGSTLQEFCDAKGLTGLVATPLALARRAGLLGKKRGRR